MTKMCGKCPATEMDEIYDEWCDHCSKTTRVALLYEEEGDEPATYICKECLPLCNVYDIKTNAWNRCECPKKTRRVKFVFIE